MNSKLDNIVVFPGAKNQQVEDFKNQEQEVLKRLEETQRKINSFISIKDFELQSFQYQILKDLAHYGDVMTFTPVAARRLIRVLANEVLSLTDILNEMEANCWCLDVDTEQLLARQDL